VSRTPVTLLEPGCGQAAGALTFPRYRHLLALQQANIIMLQAGPAHRPTGFLLARQGELLSLFVTASMRGQGVGGYLLQAYEGELRRRDVVRMHTVWTDGTPGARSFAASLGRAGWSAPQARMVIYGASFQRLGLALWMNAFNHLGPEFWLGSWEELAASQLTALRQVVRFEGWVPPELDPFKFTGVGMDGAASEPRFNLACTFHDEVVGWNLAHRLDATTLRVSCTLVRPDLQHHLLMLALWREVFRRNQDAAYSRVSWGVAVAREPMVAFNDRHFAAYVDRRATSWGSVKDLGAGE
jgi:GNAT superfamily N-acetyltransferase